MSRSLHPVLRKLGRLGRFIIFLCTLGWIFPHVCTEDMDVERQTPKKRGPAA